MIAATGLAGLLVGSVLGVTATDPTGSSEYQELLSARQELELTNDNLERELLDTEAERDDAIGDYEDAVAGADEREAELDEREVGLDQRSAELDQFSLDLDARSADLDARSAELDAREEAVSGLESYVEENSFGSGTLLVGEQVAAGTYSAPGGSGCYWERLSGTSGEMSEIIANDFIPEKAQVIVTIRSSDVAFNSSDCGTWTLVP